MASLKESCDSNNKFIKRLEEFKQELQNAHDAHFNTLQVNISKEFRNVKNVLRIEILEEIRSLRRDLLELKSSDSVRDDATYTMSPEPEDLEDEPQRKRRRPRNKLTVDKATQLSSSYMRARIADQGVELRCQSAEQDRIVIRTPESTSLTRPAHGGPTRIGALDRASGALIADRMANVGRTPAVDRPVESAEQDRIVIRTPESTSLTRPAHGGPTRIGALDRASGALIADRMANVGRTPVVDRPVESAEQDRILTRTPESTSLTRPAHGGPTRIGALDRASGALIADRMANVGRTPAVDRPVESAEQDRIVIRTPESTSLTRPAHGGPTRIGALDRASGALIADRMANVGRTPVVDRPVEEVLFQRLGQNQAEKIIQAETSIDKTIDDLTIQDKTIQDLTFQDITIQDQDEQDQVMQDISNIVNISVRNVQDTETVARDSMDIADLPTKKPITISQKKRASENEKKATKRRAQRPSTLDRSAEISRIILSPNELSNTEKTSMLLEVGLADAQPRPARAGTEPATPTHRERRTHSSEGSETPLGSLDRTKVSLGESEKTTDSKRFIDEQWGVQGTMLKIFHCVVKGVPRITVESLIQRWPVDEAHRRIIAARCFTSILKLHNNGLIKVTKDKVTNSIKHIELGPRITEGR